MAPLIFAVLARRNNGFDKILISEKGIMINDKRIDLTVINSITAESLHRIKVKSGKIEELLPFGRITFIVKDLGEISVETINPLSLAEKIIVWLNKIYRDMDEKVFLLKESLTNKTIYVRE